MDTPRTIMVSIVVPCYNEAQVLPDFLEALHTHTQSIENAHFEFLFIDDGSNDETDTVLHEAASKDSRIKILSLARNYGHQRALTAGLDHCQGDFAIFMDADLQDPPELIPQIVEKLLEGFDIVHTVRSDRGQDSLPKRVSSSIFYTIMRHWVLPELPLNAGDYKGLNRKAIQGVRNYNERVRFLRGTIATLGFNQCEIPFHRPARLAGKSKYPLFKVLRLARDAVVSNTVIPLRVAIFLGLVCIGLGLITAIALGVAICSTRIEPGLMHTILVAVLLIGGANLLFMGILGEYIKVLMLEVKQRPLYLVQSRFNMDDPDQSAS